MQDNPVWTFPTAVLPPDDAAVHSQPTLAMPRVRPRRRWRTIAARLGIALAVLLLILAGSGVFFWFNPPALGTISQPFLPAQPGTVTWNGSDTINILAMGADQRPGESDAHSDTMIVITLDPGGNKVRMTSIPRDLAVSVPGYGDRSKINTGYEMGAVSNAVQGGPKYAAFTVEQSLGIPVSYYAVLNFNGFQRLIDALGGVDMNVDADINDPSYPDAHNGFSPFVIGKGWHHLDGATALRYVRERHAYPNQEDQARIRHQQQLISALSGKMVSLHTLLNLPSILAALRGAIVTNLPDNLLPVVALKMLQDRTIEHAYLDEKSGLAQQCLGGDQGANLCPIQPQFDAKLAQLFGRQRQQIEDEHAAILVQNGTAEADETHHVIKLLRACHFTVLGGANADNNHHAHNAVIVNSARPPAPYTTRLLRQMFGARLIERAMPEVQAQLVLVVGNDTPLIPYVAFQQS